MKTNPRAKLEHPIADKLASPSWLESFHSFSYKPLMQSSSTYSFFLRDILFLEQLRKDIDIAKKSLYALGKANMMTRWPYYIYGIRGNRIHF